MQILDKLQNACSSFFSRTSRSTKAYFTVYFALFTVYVEGRGWLKTPYGGKELAEKSE